MKVVGPVYHITCDRCDATYVGEKERLLKTRLMEHQRKSSVWNEVSQHVHVDRLEHGVSLDNVMALVVENRKFERREKEAIYIRVAEASHNKDGECYIFLAVWTNLLKTRAECPSPQSQDCR